jgi:hypothetical protein
MILKRKNRLFFLLLALLFCACEKEEIAIAPHMPGDELSNEIEMTEDYRNQLFFDFETNSVVSSNLKTEWDLGFESDGERIVLNTSKGMAIHHSTANFEDVSSTSGLDWSWDAHSGNLDSTAVGDWQSLDLLYVVDKGYSYTGSHQGYYKMKVLSSNENSYQIEYGELSSTNPMNITLPKNQLTSFSYFSFGNGLLEVAPAKEDYDLLFTQYTHLFTNPITPYLVTGVLLNPYNTQALLIEDKEFGEIAYEDIEGLAFSDEINKIGYNWKGYDLEAGSFTTYPEMVFVVKTWDEKHFKIHFTSFYNEAGLKGFPNIEFQEL